MPNLAPGAGGCRPPEQDGHSAVLKSTMDPSCLNCKEIAYELEVDVRDTNELANVGVRLGPVGCAGRDVCAPAVGGCGVCHAQLVRAAPRSGA